MSATRQALRFQVGARTIFAIDRALVRVALSLDDALAVRAPTLPTLDRDADGYAITSLPEARVADVATGGLFAFVRQHYTRHYIDLTIGHDAYLAGLSANTRSGIKRKAKKLAQANGGTLDVRRFRTPTEIEAFHEVALTLSRKTYQAKLLGGGLPEDARFVRSMLELAAADAVRAWLLYLDGQPAAYLYCPVDHGTVRYDHVGHDPAFADLSPGSVLQMEAMRDLFAEGCHRRFDFTEGEGQHKRQFATDGVACVDLLLLRPTIANRATVAALGAFDGGMARAKRIVNRLGLQALARRIRR
ncbi:MULTISPECIES: GNAT family N-acetyltransferase [Sphingomonas]|uniref:GNAT family N-acetyltransferase n=1 Tax=Sphingomonas TaxID=13687 RepID=UPI0009EC6E71|nr:GNAT family N-acetyltransferase [Sphingomonas sp. CCH10-B3]